MADDPHARFMAVYQWMLDHNRELTEAATDLVTAKPGYADQLRAAVSEAHRSIGDHKRILPDAGWNDHDTVSARPSEDEFLRATALMSAAIAVASIEFRCPHANPGYQMVGPTPITFLARHGVLTCRRSAQCVPDHVQEVVPDDECDLCRAKAVVFTPMLVQLGPFTVVAHACDWCRAQIPATPHG